MSTPPARLHQTMRTGRKQLEQRPTSRPTTRSWIPPADRMPSIDRKCALLAFGSPCSGAHGRPSATGHSPAGERKPRSIQSAAHNAASTRAGIPPFWAVSYRSGP